MIRVLGWLLGGLVLLAVVGTVGFAVWARVAPEDPSEWHVDPMTVTPPASPNTRLVAPNDATGDVDAAAPVFEGPPERLMEAFAAVAAEAPRTELIAGSVEELHATWRQRSALMGFPDYVSVRAMPAGDGGSTLAVYSRSRFGRSDFGVNRERVSSWLSSLESRLE